MNPHTGYKRLIKYKGEKNNYIRTMEKESVKYYLILAIYA